MDKLLYQAAMYLKTGHPSYRQAWLTFLGQHMLSDNHVNEVRVQSGLTAAEVTRAIIRGLNGLNPHATSKPRSINA